MAEHRGVEDVELSEASLGLGRRLARMVIQRVIVPLIVTGLVGLDEAIELIKRGVVAALADTGEANGFLAGHVSKSRSWFQEYLRRAREEERRPTVRLESSELPAEEESGESYRLMSRVVISLLSAFPGSLGLSELRKQVGLADWEITDDELARCLGFYMKLGVLRVVGYDHRGPVVQATDQFPVTAPRPGQVEALGKRMGWVLPLAVAYCQGKGDFGGFVGELSPRALEKARHRLREAAADIFAEAIADTHKSDEPATFNVPVRVIIAIGETGGFDEQR